jgi:pathogenesis-related protein 1
MSLDRLRIRRARTLNQITNLLLLLIVTSLLLPATGIMYASGSPENSDESADGDSTESSEESDSGSMDDESDSGSMDDESDSGSMDDESDSGSMDDESDAWSMEKSNNALDSGSMDDASGDGSMDDESDAWSMEKSNNALAPGTTETSGEPDSVPTGTNDALTPLTPGPTGSNNALNPLGTTPAETDNALSPLSIGGPPGTNDALSPLSSGFRIESNNTGNVQENSNTGVCSAGNVCFSGGELAETILELINKARAEVGVPPLTWNNTLAAHAQTYADYLEVTGKNEHPSAEWVAKYPTGPEGENLYSQEGGDLSQTSLAQAAFKFWYSEQANYNGQPIGSETPGEIIGHYTQMVWKGTTQVGCAAVTGQENPINGLPTARLSCRFTPPGNFVGQTPY